MGAYAPAPIVTNDIIQKVIREVVQPTLDGMKKEGIPYRGCLYVGLMMTPNGPKVLEYNCRFGDPETQALMPLLDSDLLSIADACARGRLSEVDVEWKSGAAACIVVAAANYPDKPRSGDAISGLETTLKNATVFHAGTRLAENQVVTAGGRVLGVTGWDESLPGALANAYAAVESISFTGMQYRRDIGKRTGN